MRHDPGVDCVALDIDSETCESCGTRLTICRIFRRGQRGYDHGWWEQDREHTPERCRARR